MDPAGISARSTDRVRDADQRHAGAAQCVRRSQRPRLCGIRATVGTQARRRRYPGSLACMPGALWAGAAGGGQAPGGWAVARRRPAPAGYRAVACAAAAQKDRGTGVAGVAPRATAPAQAGRGARGTGSPPACRAARAAAEPRARGVARRGLHQVPHAPRRTAPLYVAGECAVACSPRRSRAWPPGHPRRDAAPRGGAGGVQYTHAPAERYHAGRTEPRARAAAAPRAECRRDVCGDEPRREPASAARRRGSRDRGHAVPAGPCAPCRAAFARSLYQGTPPPLTQQTRMLSREQFLRRALAKKIVHSLGWT